MEKKGGQEENEEIDMSVQSTLRILAHNLHLLFTREIEDRLNKRADVYEKTVDTRLDDRLNRHERLIRQMALDVLERNDILYQLFEERLDKQRREIRALRQALDFKLMMAPPLEKGDEKHASNGGSNHVKAGDVALYHKIIAWKNLAHEGIDQFPPDEQEMVDYLLSFTDDPKDSDYLKIHMRRIISTLQRIPIAQTASDRLLELGSRFSLAPAITKFSGYQEVCGADIWESDEAQIRKTVKQKNGPDSYTFEVRNFNVERDRFPYPDKFFRVVLCCELIEHLQSDPMHMLWECNRVLVEGGYLILTTPNITSARAIEAVLVGCVPYLYPQYNIKDVTDQHHREYAPREIGEFLAAAGFSVEELETQDVWLRSNPAILDLLADLMISTELRGDNIFALGRKTGAPVERYPKELYVG
jgi:SAM-dependent methyltransferase